MTSGKTNYVIPLGASGESAAAVCFSVGQVRSSSLINPEHGATSRKYIELYLFGGELERYFSCLGHIFSVWEFYVRSNDGAISFSTWPLGTRACQSIF